MGFLMRSTDPKDPKYQEKKQKYFKHLGKFDPGINPDLMRYFHYDFFHDGYIDKIVLEKGLNEIRIDISCPNFEEKLEGEDFQYICADFQCYFRDVAYLNFETPTDKSKDPFIFEDFTFMYSEINTLSAIMKKYSKRYDEDYYSIIMELLSNHSSCILSMVFSQVDVIPKEPLAFQLMLNDDKYRIPGLFPNPEG